MARSLQGHLEEEADRKGLTGEAKKQYVGGAWNRIKGKDERSRWRHSQDSELLARHFGRIHDMRESKDGSFVVFRQSNVWYRMPRQEYHTLVDAAERDERERQWAKALIQREREQDARRKASEQQKREQESARQARAQQLAEQQAQREIERFERVQYSEVVGILKRSGGIRPFKKLVATGKGYMRDEYAALPSTVRSAKGRLDMDEAAAAVHEEIPWLKIETPDDLLQYFERHRDYRRSHSRVAEVWWERRVV